LKTPLLAELRLTWRSRWNERGFESSAFACERSLFHQRDALLLRGDYQIVNIAIFRHAGTISVEEGDAASERKRLSGAVAMPVRQFLNYCTHPGNALSSGRPSGSYRIQSREGRGISRKAEYLKNWSNAIDRLVTRTGCSDKGRSRRCTARWRAWRAYAVGIRPGGLGRPVGHDRRGDRSCRCGLQDTPFPTS
jgi:hypothetical protein